MMESFNSFLKNSSDNDSVSLNASKRLKICTSIADTSIYIIFKLIDSVADQHVEFSFSTWEQMLGVFRKFGFSYCEVNGTAFINQEIKVFSQIIERKHTVCLLDQRGQIVYLSKHEFRDMLSKAAEIHTKYTQKEKSIQLMIEHYHKCTSYIENEYTRCQVHDEQFKKSLTHMKNHMEELKIAPDPLPKSSYVNVADKYNYEIDYDGLAEVDEQEDDEEVDGEEEDEEVDGEEQDEEVDGEEDDDSNRYHSSNDENDYDEYFY